MYMAPYNRMRSLQKKYVYGSIQSYAELTKEICIWLHTIVCGAYKKYVTSYTV